MTLANKYVYARVLINMDNSCMLLPDLLFITRFLFIYLFLIIIFCMFYNFSNPTRVGVPFTGLWNLHLVI